MQHSNLSVLQQTLLRQNINMSPMRVELELTEQCNLFCSFCYNSQNPVVSQKASDIISRLYDENVMEIILTGGEPMLHPNFEALYLRCCELFSKVMVQTNGTKITKSVANFFAQTGIFGVNVSLHGLQEVHETLTKVPGSFDSAVTGIAHLLSAGVNVASNFVLTSVNAGCLPATIDYLYELGVREITLTRFTPTGVGARNAELAISCDQLNEALTKAKEKCALYGDLHMILANSIPYCALRQDLKQFCEYCHFGSSRFYVDVSGHVLMCGMSRISIGNILEQSFHSMKASSEIYCAHVCGTDVPYSCQSCEHFRICRGGCRAAALAHTGVFDGSDPYAICKN